jgi:hypothetical protein
MQSWRLRFGHWVVARAPFVSRPSYSPVHGTLGPPGMKRGGETDLRMRFLFSRDARRVLIACAALGVVDLVGVIALKRSGFKPIVNLPPHAITPMWLWRSKFSPAVLVPYFAFVLCSVSWFLRPSSDNSSRDVGKLALLAVVAVSLIGFVASLILYS